MLGRDAKSPDHWALFVEGRETPIASQIEVAFDSKTRNRGLLGRTGLPPGSALIIAPSNAVHTFGMRFPIDVVFARRDGIVVKIRAAVPRSRMTFALGGFAVIEFAAGETERSSVRVGDHLVVRTRS